MHRTLLLSLLLLGGCNSNYDFSSNLDPEPIKDYFSVGNVVMYDSIPANAKTLGFVDGDSCQMEASQPPADAASARTQLRQAAATLGANGVVVSQCVALDEIPGCLTNIQCSGQAIKTEK